MKSALSFLFAKIPPTFAAAIKINCGLFFLNTRKLFFDLLSLNFFYLKILYFYILYLSVFSK